MINHLNEFDGDTWKFNALMDYVAYKELHEFVLNDAATKAHANSYRLSGDGLRFPAGQLRKMQEVKVATLREALTHFACQTIVSLCTTYEVTARDFFRTYFQIKPAAMFEYLGPEDAKGHVPLREIVQAASHSDLITRLSDRASSIASKGKYGHVYARAFSLCSSGESKELTERLNNLQGDRNKLIHERHRPDAGIKEVLAAHSVVDAAIEGLCKLCAGQGMPGRYTCVRPEIHLAVHDVATLL